MSDEQVPFQVQFPNDQPEAFNAVQPVGENNPQAPPVKQPQAAEHTAGEMEVTSLSLLGIYEPLPFGLIVRLLLWLGHS